jgi:hypothetical protein
LLLQSGDTISVVTIRPSQNIYKGFVVGNAAIVVPILLSNLATAGRSDGGISWVTVVAIFGPVLLLLGLGIMLYFRNTRVDFGQGMISRTNMLGTTKSWRLDSIGFVLDVPTLVAPHDTPVHTLFVLDDTERQVVRVSGRTWAPEQMEQLVEATGVTPLTLNGPTTAKSIQERFPQVIGWREAHPYQFAVVGTIVFFVPFVVAGAILVQLS